MSGFEDDDFFDEKEGEEATDETKEAPVDDEVEAGPPKKRAKKSKADDDIDDEDFDGDYEDMEEEKTKRLPPPVKENKFVKFTGKITPLTRDEKNAVTGLQITSVDDQKAYTIEMNEIGKQLIKRCFHELFVTGELVPKADKKFILVVKSYL
jgi:hypothetical protein